MNDKDFLMWIHERLTNVYGENPLVDYMHRLRSIISCTPERHRSLAASYNSLSELQVAIVEKENAV